jgi:8-oxo-dGTP pyrophosphatase MutT (NUDIX family)
MLGNTRIVPIEQADVRLVHRPRPFARNNLAEIDAHWQRRTAEQPQLYNGCILMLDNWSLSNGRFAGECVATNYKDFLYLRECNKPNRDNPDFFPAAALHSQEGWLILGRMASHTTNSGYIYPPCGGLHPDDVIDGTVDLDGCMIREVQEETGLLLSRSQFDAPMLVFDDRRIVYLRPTIIPEPAIDIANRIEQFLKTQQEPELAGVYIVKSTADIRPAKMPPFVIAYIEHRFG